MNICSVVPTLTTSVATTAIFALCTPELPPSLDRVPDWARTAIWYQIFPERFRNGDPSNDPTVDDISGAWPHERPAAWSISRWTGDWYKLQPWEEDGKGFYYHAQQRRYGGDLQGVLDKLDYFASLGINAIYFNPLFESPSLHKYDAAMYHHIDNNFGPDPKGDAGIWGSEDPGDPSTWKWTGADKLLLKLLAEAHKRGMHVILDGVFNHVGATFWAFQDVRKRGEKSPYKEWFDIKAWDNPATKEDEFDYAGWGGIKDLPELREDEHGLVHGPREHIKAVLQRWMDPDGDGNPSDGIDGWRLDVAEMVGIPFWRQFRSWVREINPDAYLVGEVWWEDWKNDKMFNAAPWLGGDVFDAVMNYRVAQAAGHFFKDRKNRISATGFDARLRMIRGDYRPEATAVLMNLLGSHDTDRLGSQIVNPDTRYDGNVNVKDNRTYDVRKPDASELTIERLMILFQMTYIGAPAIYYGDEVGMWGADDPDERKPMLWADMTYDDEVSHPFGMTRPRDRNEVNRDLLDWYTKLISTRKAHPALSGGNITTILTDDAKEIIAYQRTAGRETVVVILNSSPLEQAVSIKPEGSLAGSTWMNLLDPKKNITSKETIQVAVPAHSGIILGTSA